MLNLQPIKERVERAIQGPWDMDVYETESNSVFDVWFNEDEYASIHGNAAIDAFYTADFITHARQDIPALIAEVERLRKALEEIETSSASDFDGIRQIARQALEGDSNG